MLKRLFLIFLTLTILFASLSYAFDEFEDEEDDFAEIEETPTTTSSPRPAKVEYPQDNSFMMEIGMCALVLLYIVNYFYGKSENEKRALVFARNVLPDLRTQFAKVGIHAENVAEDSPMSYFVRESKSCYKLYASGRNNCMGIVLTLTLAHRQDLFSRLFSLVTESTDTLTIEIPVKKMQPFVFVLCKKSHRTKFRTGYEDVKALCKEVVVSSLEFKHLERPNSYAFLTDCQQSSKSFLSTTMCKKLNAIRNQFEFLYFTDRIEDRLPPNDPIVSKRYLCFEFSSLDSAGKKDRSLLEIALSYVDAVSRFQMTPKEQQTSIKIRTSIEKQKNKEKLKEKRKKREEKQREEKLAQRNRKYEALKTEEAKQKFEEAEEKRKKKKRLKKMRGKMKRG